MARKLTADDKNKLPERKAKLPAKGEPIVFGEHRLEASKRVCAAWPELSTIEGQRKAAFTRFLRPNPVNVGGADKPDTEGSRETKFKLYVAGARRDLNRLMAGTLPGWTFQPKTQETAP
jgi:hypothetical protein